MQSINDRLTLGENHFGSGGHNTPQFNKFYLDFKKAFKKELDKVGATEMIASKGHFYLSGFFKAESGQLYYFSLSDVRHGFGGRSNNQLLYRTAQHTKDWTGGGNCYVNLGVDMFENIRL
jgi:hypothetical protein